VCVCVGERTQYVGEEVLESLILMQNLQCI